jgi:uncharacterized membrane protein YgcG
MIWITTISRLLRLSTIAAVACIVTVARAAERTPYPAFSGDRVYIAGVADRFDGLTDQIKRLEKSSPQTYYVAVVKSFGDGQHAAQDYVDELFRVWQNQASRQGLTFDPERSVIVAVALGERKIGVHAGATLREKLGLRSTVSSELIEDKFIRLAKQEKYPDAISTLLNGINDWIAAKDRATSRTIAKAPLPAPEPSSPPSSTKATARPSVATPSPVATVQPVGSSTGTQVAIGLGLAAVAIVLLVLGAVWWKHSRERTQVGHRLKEFRSQAVRVMDRLDSIKERLKLLPAERPDFSEPMTGETRAFFDMIQARVGKLWDRWLEIMNQLDQAQKLTSNINTPFDQKKVYEAAKLLEAKGLFEEMDAEAQACIADLDKLNAAHEDARSILRAIVSDQPKIDTQLDAAKKLDLPTAVYQDEHAAIVAGTDAAKASLTADPLGTKTALERVKGRTEALLTRIERVVILFRDAQKTQASLETVKRQVAGHRGEDV